MLRLRFQFSVRWMMAATAVLAFAVWLCTANRVLPLLGFAGVVGMLLCWLGGRCFRLAHKTTKAVAFIAHDVVGALLLAAGLWLTAISVLTAVISQ